MYFSLDFRAENYLYYLEIRAHFPIKLGERLSMNAWTASL